MEDHILSLTNYKTKRNWHWTENSTYKQYHKMAMIRTMLNINTKQSSQEPVWQMHGMCMKEFNKRIKNRYAKLTLFSGATIK